MTGHWSKESATANARWIAADLAVVAVWVVLVTMAFRLAGGPTPFYYVVVFGGILAYSLAPTLRNSARS